MPAFFDIEQKVNAASRGYILSTSVNGLLSGSPIITGIYLAVSCLFAHFFAWFDDIIGIT